MIKLTETARQEMDGIANRLFEAIERADFDGVKQIYAPDVKYWMNFTDQSQGLDEILEMTRIFNGKIKGLHYEIEAREFFPGGFVQRCRITGELKSGGGLNVPLCLVIYVADGRIVQIYEYLDVASMMPALA